MSAFSSLFSGGGGSGLYSVPQMGYKTGRYYFVNPATQSGTDSDLDTVNGTLYYTPFYVHSDISIQSIFFANTNTSANGRKVMVGVYANDGGIPGALQGQGSEVTLNASAAVREVTLSLSLSKGWYWMALQCDGAAKINAIAGTEAGQGWSLFSSATAQATLATSRVQNSVTSTYESLPSTAVAPTTSAAMIIFGLRIT